MILITAFFGVYLLSMIFALFRGSDSLTIINGDILLFMCAVIVFSIVNFVAKRFFDGKRRRKKKSPKKPHSFATCARCIQYQRDHPLPKTKDLVADINTSTSFDGNPSEELPPHGGIEESYYREMALRIMRETGIGAKSKSQRGSGTGAALPEHMQSALETAPPASFIKVSSPLTFSPTSTKSKPSVKSLSFECSTSETPQHIDDDLRSSEENSSQTTLPDANLALNTSASVSNVGEAAPKGPVKRRTRNRNRNRRRR